MMQLTARNILAYLYANVLIFSGQDRRYRKSLLSTPKILSIYFHDPSKKLFSSCISWLKGKGFSFISVEMLADIIDGRLPFPKNAVLITVDDGWKGNADNIVAVAQQHSLPVTIFIATEPAETGGGYWWSYVKQGKKMGLIKEQVEELKIQPNNTRKKLVNTLKSRINIEHEAMTPELLMEIDQCPTITLGGHTHSHPILTSCSDEEAGSEIIISKQKLEKWLGHPTSYFAYPNGDYGMRELMLMREMGFRLAFSTVPGYIDQDSPMFRYALPRLEVLSDVSFSENICRMTGLWFGVQNNQY